MLLRSVQLVRKLESRARNAGFFLNLSPAMLARIETFNPLYEFLQRERERAGNLVLEFAYEGVRALDRSEERRVGKECVLKCNSRWSPYPQKKRKQINNQLR